MKPTVTMDTKNQSASLPVAGDLDYVTTADVVDSVARLLVEQPGLRHLRLDCADLTFCDSAGLSGLLQIHRHASVAGVQLHLDHRPPHLERLLQITGTLDHLTETADLEAESDGVEPTGIADGAEIASGRDERNA